MVTCSVEYVCVRKEGAGVVVLVVLGDNYYC